jgi:transposase
MALTSPDRIEMNPSQQQRLRHLIRAGTTPQQLVLRARIVLLAVAGWTNSKIAARVGVCVDTVRKWRHRWWVQPGTASLGDAKRSGRAPSFTPVQVAAVKALACQPPEASGVPLSRWSCTDLAAQVVADGITASVSTSTVRRWLAEDAIKPWQSANDYVVSADEKTSIQARCRCHPSMPAGKARMMRVSHDYHRGGALAYLAAYDVHRAKIYRRCEATTGIEPVTALVAQVMTQEP